MSVQSPGACTRVLYFYGKYILKKWLPIRAYFGVSRDYGAGTHIKT